MSSSTKNLFNQEIHNWNEWTLVYKSIRAFYKIIISLFEKEHLPLSRIENVGRSTNAVFKIGNYILKLYAIKESEIESIDRETEFYVTNFVESLGIKTASAIANGIIKDKYTFEYIIFKYIDGIELKYALLNSDELKQYKYGKKLRYIADKINIPSKKFNNIEIINNPFRNKRWNIFSENLQKERIKYITQKNFGKYVLVHGDMGKENIMVDKNDDLILIDYGDAVLAPKIYEDVLIFFEFYKNPFLVYGFYEGIEKEKLIEILFDGLLIHDYLIDDIKDRLGEISEYKNIYDLKEKIKKFVNEFYDNLEISFIKNKM